MNALSIRLKSIVGLAASLLLAVAAPCLGEAPNVQKTLETATGGSPPARYTAIDDLGENPTNATAVVPALQKLLGDKDAQVRWRAARALGDYRDLAKSAAPPLRSLLKDSDPIAQYHAAVALGKLEDKSPETIQALVAAATSKDERAARAAISALRELDADRSEVLKSLADVLDHDDEAVVLHALEAIVEQDDKAAPILIEALKDPDTEFLALAAIERLGPDAKATVPTLTELIGKTKHSKLLIQELLALAAIGPDAASAAPKIVPLLDAKDDKTIPVAAAYALGSIGALDAEGALSDAMKKDNPFLQMVAAWSLAKLHPDSAAFQKAAVDKLVQGLANNDPIIRTAAAKGLQSLKAPPEMVGPELVKLINDKDPEVQSNVVDAIASLGESVVPRVSAALERPEIRESAVRVIRKLGPKGAGAVPALMKAAEGADPKFRTDIQLAFGAIGPAAAPATEMLVKSLESKDAGERESALYALRQIGPKAAAATRPLNRLMQANDSFDSLAAAWALVRIAPGNAKIAEALVPKLSGSLNNADEVVRLESAAALGEMGAAAKSAAKDLEHTSKTDSSDSVRETAAEALKQVQS